MRSIYVCITIDSIGLIIAGISYKWYIIAVGLSLMGFLSPRINGFFGSIMQSKIPNDKLGKVSSVVSAIVSLFTPIAILLSGVLADYVFKPLLIESGSLANTFVGDTIGVGDTRGIGLMFIVAGILQAIIGILCLLDKKILSFEKDYPDVIE